MANFKYSFLSMGKSDNCQYGKHFEVFGKLISPLTETRKSSAKIGQEKLLTRHSFLLPWSSNPPSP